MRRWRPASSAVVVAVLAGCGGSGNDGDEQVESTATSASTASVADTTEPVNTAATTEPTEPATTAVVATSPTMAEEVEVAQGVIPGTATIALLTDGAGLGPRPLLRWEAADGAVSYVVSVNAPSGGPMWAWEGSVTEVPFGGGPADDPDTTGAQLVGPATWFVAALDAEGLVIATSATADLAP